LKLGNNSVFRITLCFVCYITQPDLTPSKYRESNGLAFSYV